MIDITTEEVLTFSKAAARLPERRKGSRPHLATFYRWAERGIRGVRLESIQIGGTRCTSTQALQRFFDRLSGIPSETETLSPPALSRERQKAIKQAERELDKAGI
jgi:hypothetical protein